MWCCGSKGTDEELAQWEADQKAKVAPPPNDLDSFHFGFSTFPNIGVSLAFFRKFLLDPRLKAPMVELALVGPDRKLTVPLTPIELNDLDLPSLRELAKSYRVFSDMDGADEYKLLYQASAPVSREELLEALRKPPTTTTQVNLCIVKPDTLDMGCAYARMLEARGDGGGMVGKPTAFISHAWRVRALTLTRFPTFPPSL